MAGWEQTVGIAVPSPRFPDKSAWLLRLLPVSLWFGPSYVFCGPLFLCFCFFGSWCVCPLLRFLLLLSALVAVVLCVGASGPSVLRLSRACCGDFANVCDRICCPLLLVLNF